MESANQLHPQVFQIWFHQLVAAHAFLLPFHQRTCWVREASLRLSLPWDRWETPELAHMLVATRRIIVSSQRLEVGPHLVLSVDSARELSLWHWVKSIIPTVFDVLLAMNG